MNRLAQHLTICWISFLREQNLSVGKREYFIVHARIRNNCSDLNYDLFKNHLFPSPTYFCSLAPETALHYFSQCPSYHNQRLNFLRKLSELHINFDFENILYGSNMLTYKQNSHIFQLVQGYIKETKRFDCNGWFVIRTTNEVLYCVINGKSNVKFTL